MLPHTQAPPSPPNKASDSESPLTQSPLTDSPLTQSPKSDRQSAVCPRPHALRQQVSRERMPFEEALGSPLEERVKQVDHAILEGLLLSGVSSGKLRIEDVGPAPQPQLGGSPELHFQRIVVQSETPPPGFLAFLSRELALLDCKAELEQRNATAWNISLLQRPTHELLFVPPHTSPEQGPPGKPGKGLVLVLDDLGLDARFARELAALPVPVTFSVLPRLANTAEVVRIAREHGRELLLHQPMEPVDAAISPGPGALFVGMPEPRVASLVRENLDKVPGAVGLNNHMGSRFTQDATGVGAVLQVASENNLFVIDSLTHPRSVFARRAKELGVPVLRRDVFLDVVRNTEAIIYQLRKAVRLAKSKGSAVAIGHPHPETLEALRIWSRQQEAQGVDVPVVTAGALVRGEKGQVAQREEPLDNSAARPLAQQGISR